MTNQPAARVPRSSRVSPARNAKIGVAGLSVSAFLALVAGLATGNQSKPVPEIMPVTTIPADQTAPQGDPRSPAVPVPAPAVQAPAVVPAPVRPPAATAPPPKPAAPNGTSRGSGG